MPRLLGLEAARRPLAAGLLPGHQLEGVAARELDVAVGLGVLLELVVGVDVEGNVPVGLARGAALAAAKVVLPDHLEAGAVGALDGRGEGDDAGEEEGEKVSHLDGRYSGGGVQGRVSREWLLR